MVSGVLAHGPYGKAHEGPLRAQVVTLVRRGTTEVGPRPGVDADCVSRNRHVPRVVVAGGGIAAAEAVLALRAHAGPAVDIEMIAAEPRLLFRPAATVAPFGDGGVESYDLAHLAAHAGATLVQDRLEAVAPDVRRVRLASGAQRDYDALVLALGARARAAVPGALTFRDQRDAAQLGELVSALRDGSLRSLALTAPAGIAWTLPLYELALLAAQERDSLGLRTRITLVTPERRELEIFGSTVSAEIAELLADADVHVVRATAPRMVDRRGLRLADGGTIEADRVLAAPALVGPRIPGVPADFGGFVSTRDGGHVRGLSGVFAAGDMTAFPVKQGGLAAQQADLVAAAIARDAGAEPVRPSATRILRAQLFGAGEPLFLETSLDARGRPVPGRSAVHHESPWWPQGTLFARHLSPWLAGEALAVA
jgi:sulfide:quinone oxidoreductase